MRTASQDANEGTTFLKERKESVATFQQNFAVTAEKSSISAFEDGAKAVQSALSVVGEATSSNPNEAIMMQGAQEGVDEAVKANKRSKFAEFFFGQDAGYATAVQQAVKNFANNEYIRQAQDMETRLGETPEEYNKRVDKVVSARIQETYKDDKDAQALAMSTWQSQSHKLSREHAFKHMAFVQQQNFAEGLRDLTRQFDIIHLNSKQGSSEEGQLEAQEELADILSKDFMYTTADGKQATKLASRNIQVAAVEKQLAAGNTDVLQALPENFEEGLTAEQMTRLSRAKQSYDTAISNESEAIVEEGLLFAAQGNLTGLNTQVQRLVAVQPRLSGSPVSKDKFNEDMIRLQRALNDAQAKVAKDSVKADNIKNYYLARENADAGKAGQYFSNKAREGADDLVVATAALRVANTTGAPAPESVAEVLDIVLNNQSAMESVALKAQQYGTISGSLAEAAKQSIMNLRPDEDGYIRQEDLKRMGHLQVLYDKAPGQMRKALGEDGSALLEITLNNRHEPWKEILHKRSEFVKNKGMTLSTQELGLPSGMSMGDYVRQELGFMDNAATARYIQHMQTGYRIYGGDTKAATNYMKQMKRVNDENWEGKVIKNAGMVEGGVQTALYKMDNTEMSRQIIASRIPIHLQDPGKPIMGFKDLNDVQFEVNPGTRELVITSSQFSFPIVMNMDTVSKVAEVAEAEQREADAIKAQARQAIFEQQAKEKRQSQFWPVVPIKDEDRKPSTQFWPTPQRYGL